MPLKCPRKLSAVRSAVKIPRAGPVMVAIDSPGATAAPSFAAISQRNVRIDQTKRQPCQIEPGDDAGFRAHQRRPRRELSRDDCIRGEIARAAEIFEKRGANQWLDQNPPRGAPMSSPRFRFRRRVQGQSFARGCDGIAEAQHTSLRGSGAARKIGSRMGAAAFPAAQGGDHDHQAARGPDRSRLPPPTPAAAIRPPPPPNHRRRAERRRRW